MLVFDIETAPRDEAELRTMLPFDPSGVEGLVDGEFDPSAVKLGNLKDTAKVEAKIAEARAAHEQAKANREQILAAAEANHWKSILDRAALSPVTGRVLAIGYYAPANDKVAIQGVGGEVDEAKLLTEFWAKYRQCRSASRRMVGFNINRFDLPFLARRSWYVGVDVPESLLDPSGRYFDKLFVDLMTRWQCGVYQESIRLHDLAQFFGVGGKPDGINGGDFGRLWHEARETAIEYLKNDLKITAGCAARMGFA